MSFPLPANDNITIISMREVMRLTSFSRTHIDRLRVRGAFPVPVELGEKRIGFVRAEVVAWIQTRIDARAEVAA